MPGIGYGYPFLQNFHLNMLAPVVKKMDSAIQWISVRETNYAIQWIENYPLDSVIHLLNNCGLVRKRGVSIDRRTGC